MFKKRFLRFLFLSSVLVLLVLALTPTPAHAGLNGQQLAVNAGCLWTKVIIIGKNQYGNSETVVKTNNSNSLLPCQNLWAKTNGYWWKGTVTIWAYNGGSKNSCTVNVPKIQAWNWTYTNCMAPP